MGYGMTGIVHEGAYEAAIKRNILENARKTWRKNTPDHETLEDALDMGRDSVLGYLDNFIGKMAKSFDTYGKLTENQCDAVRNIMTKRAERRVAFTKALDEQKARSQYLGVENERVQFKLHVDKILEIEVPRFSYYDSNIMYFYLMRDAAGNRVVYRSKAVLGISIKGGERDIFIDVKEGDDIEIKATIKAHDEYKGEKQTIVQRAKVVLIENKE